MSTEGRAHVVMALGESADHPELLALTIPDARTLVRSVRSALDGPMVPLG